MAEFDPQDPSTFGGNIPGTAQVSAPTPVMPGTGDQRQTAMRELPMPPELSRTKWDTFREALHYVGAGLKEMSRTRPEQGALAKAGAEEQAYRDQIGGRTAFGYMTRLSAMVGENPDMALLANRALGQFLTDNAADIPLSVQQAGKQTVDQFEGIHRNETLRAVLGGLPPGSGPQLEAAARMAKLFPKGSVNAPDILKLASMVPAKDFTIVQSPSTGQFIQITRNPDGTAEGKVLAIDGFTPTGKNVEKFQNLPMGVRNAILAGSADPDRLPFHDLIRQWDKGDPRALKEMSEYEAQADAKAETKAEAAAGRIEDRQRRLQESAADMIPKTGPKGSVSQASLIEAGAPAYTKFSQLQNDPASAAQVRSYFARIEDDDKKAAGIANGRRFVMDASGNLIAEADQDPRKYLHDPDYTTVDGKGKERIEKLHMFRERLMGFGARVQEMYAALGPKHANVTLGQALQLYLGAESGSNQLAKFIKDERGELGILAGLAFAPGTRFGQYMSDKATMVIPDFRDSVGNAAAKINWLLDMDRQGIQYELGRNPKFNITPEAAEERLPFLRGKLGTSAPPKPTVKGAGGRTDVGGGVTWEDR